MKRGTFWLCLVDLLRFACGGWLVQLVRMRRAR